MKRLTKNQKADIKNLTSLIKSCLDYDMVSVTKWIDPFDKKLHKLREKDAAFIAKRVVEYFNP